MRQITIDKMQNKISIAEYGNRDGYPILVQHGLIASIKDFSIFKILIDNGIRLICIARPGYGESSPYILRNIGEWGNAVNAIVEELKIEQFDVLGISSGAPYSYAIGHRLPNNVRNIYILSGTPALYNEQVVSVWPYPIDKNASISAMEKIANELFFSNLSVEDLAKNEIKDSMMNNCYGIGQDLIIRCLDWGFNLSDIRSCVYMRHSKIDTSVPLSTAEITSKLLSNCKFEIRENDVHFSKEVLDCFINEVIIPNVQ
jgi:pimeloyl-ACP methyl ester carboxylesterase